MSGTAVTTTIHKMFLYEGSQLSLLCWTEFRTIQNITFYDLKKNQKDGYMTTPVIYNQFLIYVLSLIHLTIQYEKLFKH